MNRIVLFIVGILLCSCTNQKDATVKHHGKLISIMGGNLEAVVSLDSIPSDHLYALGAVEDLKGEIQIFNGKSFISKTTTDGNVQILDDLDHKAALLVHAQVKEWTSPVSLKAFSTNQELEKQIKATAIASDIDISKPFPFLLTGTANELKWHVINWPDNDKNHSHYKHITSGANGTLQDQEMSILGFYSEKHQAVFTHHTTFLHMHFKTEGDLVIAGHVDELKATDLSLSLPQR